MKRKKVLLLADNLNNGGAERQLMLLAKNIPNTWDVFLWSIEGGVFLSDLRQTGIRHAVSPRKFQFDPSPFFCLLKTVREYQPDVMHSWGWMSTLAGAIISKILGIPLVNGIIRTAKPYYYRGNISKILSRYGDHVISNSQAGLTNWGIPPERGTVIYNGFDEGRLKNLPKSKSDEHIFRIVMAARMVKAKDFQLFIHAARQVSLQGISNWKFMAIGDGEDKAWLQNENADLVEKGILEFPDAGTEVIPFLANSDVGVLLSKAKLHEEGCSNSIMEYMACGLPVVATDSGGNKELVEPKTGILVTDGDLEEFVKTLTWLYEYPLERVNLGRNGKEKLHEVFSINRMVQDTIAVYEKVLAR